MVEAITFYALFAWLLAFREGREMVRSKTRFEWLLDTANLLIQGLAIPALQIGLYFILLKALLPDIQGILKLSWLGGFLLNFIFVDYLYYWNHRLFHSKKLFPVHLVHHSVTQMDVMATSRNTLWTSFLIVYLWANGLFLYLTDFNAGYLVAMSLSACLDLWKHSSLMHSRPEWQMALSKYLFVMTPLDHAWHHAEKLNYNFGANLNLFDKLHGTFTQESAYPARLGVKHRLTPFQQLLFPFRAK
ncbi:MAG: sterol desaturase family protein [Candidatus Sericytochromatia bacterium]